MEQKPSIGRVVHYQKFGTPNGEHKSERGMNKAMSVLGLDKEYKRIEAEKNAALKALEDFKKVSNDQTLTPAEKDKRHEEIADSIADKLRNI